MKKYAHLTILLMLVIKGIAQPVKPAAEYLNQPRIFKDSVFKIVEFFDYAKKPTTEFLPEWKEGVVYAGKSTFEISVKNLQVDATGNAARQWMAKVPGITVWESDGSGLNTSISTRGWSANRSWDLNVRMDGMDIASDPMGYPEAYYAPPTEFISTIQLIKGAGALAYGTQFGGFLNYATLQPGNGKVQYNGTYSVGSFQTQSAFHAIHGSIGKWKYGVWLQQRESDGWRKNSTYKTQNAMVKLSRSLKNDFNVQLEYIKHFSTAQQAGGLTDAQWLLDPTYSSRARNWFQLDWQVMGVDITQKKENHFWSNKFSYMRGIRNSIGFLKTINIEDDGGNRNLNLDAYNNLSFESRYTQFFANGITWSGGVRGFKGRTDRQMDEWGGSAESDANFQNVIGSFSRDLDYTSLNAAAFNEMIFQWKKFKLIPGVRYEFMRNEISGQYSSAFQVTPQSKDRNVFLYGLGFEYHINPENELVINYNRSFRPVLFSELTPNATTDVIDPQLKDARGYNGDVFLRGKIIKNRLQYQVGVYYTQYGNKVGNYKINDVRYVTNIGDAVSKGVEALLDYTVTRANQDWSLNVWTALSWMNVKYTEWNDPSITDAALSRGGKWVEYAPRYIHRAGMNTSYRNLSIQLNGNWVSSVYTDALNSIDSDIKASVGKLQGYELVDVSIKYNFTKFIHGQMNVNNVFNERYATRRSGSYPGPGLLPGSPRNVTLTLGLTI